MNRPKMLIGSTVLFFVTGALLASEPAKPRQKRTVRRTVFAPKPVGKAKNTFSFPKLTKSSKQEFKIKPIKVSPRKSLSVAEINARTEKTKQLAIDNNHKRRIIFQIAAYKNAKDSLRKENITQRIYRLLDAIKNQQIKSQAQKLVEAAGIKRSEKIAKKAPRRSPAQRQWTPKLTKKPIKKVIKK